MIERIANSPAVVSLFDLVWPRHCWLCDNLVTEGQFFRSLCANCVSELCQPNGQVCPRCSSDVGPYTDTEEGCMSCIRYRYRFLGTTRMGRYGGQLREAILLSKHANAEGLAETLGEMFAEHQQTQLALDNPELVVPVPLHWRKKFSRGLNQAEAIARGLAGKLGIPMETDAVRRVRETLPQTEQSPTGRWENVKGAFVPTGKLAKGVRVLLVDDVLTTGATADAVASALIQAGAAQVRVAVLAHR